MRPVEGYYSWRNTAKGSWFIQTLTDELTKSLSSSDDVDLSRVLTVVTRRVAFEFQSIAAISHLNAKKQVPAIHSTLTREIHFPPLLESQGSRGSPATPVVLAVD